MAAHCRGQESAVADLCDVVLESADLRHNPGRSRRADRDGVHREFRFYRCAVPGVDDIPDGFAHRCSEAAQAPFVCQETVPLEHPTNSICTCWGRRDWKGLTEEPHVLPSLTDEFPLDRQYPTTAQVYHG